MRSLSLVTLVVTVFLLGACVSGSHKAEPKGDPAEANTRLAVEYMREGMYEAAMEKFRKALKQNPQLQMAHSSVAILYERLGETELADKHYRKAYNLNRKDALTLNNYGRFLCREGRLKEADKMFMTAISDPLYKYPEMVYTNAGICSNKKPDAELADKYFRKALQQNPKYSPALREMAKSSFARQEYLSTRAYLQRLQAVATLTPEYLWIGVRTESELGDQNAVSSYTLLLKNKYPEADETRTLINWERNTGER